MAPFSDTPLRFFAAPVAGPQNHDSLKCMGEPELDADGEEPIEGDTRAVSASELAAVLARVDGGQSDPPPPTVRAEPAATAVAASSPDDAVTAPPPAAKKNENQISGARRIAPQPAGAPEPAPALATSGASRELMIGLAVLAALAVGLLLVALR